MTGLSSHLMGSLISLSLSSITLISISITLLLFFISRASIVRLKCKCQVTSWVVVKFYGKWIVRQPATTDFVVFIAQIDMTMGGPDPSLTTVMITKSN